MKIETDERGHIVGFAYHDGDLKEVALADGNCIKLRGASVDGIYFQVELHDASTFSLDEFREGNIIDVMCIWNFERAEKSAISRLMMKTGLKEDGLEARYGRQQGFFVFVLECSYGAEVLAVAKSITVSFGNIGGKGDGV